MYIDDITPGNPLRPDNKRKITAVYASCIELGNFLRLEEAWLALGVIRTNVVKEVKGGLSNAIRQLLKGHVHRAPERADGRHCPPNPAAAILLQIQSAVVR